MKREPEFQWIIKEKIRITNSTLNRFESTIFLLLLQQSLRIEQNIRVQIAKTPFIMYRNRHNV